MCKLNIEGTVQKLFAAIKGYFQSVYDSVRNITGIRIDAEVDMFLGK